MPYMKTIQGHREAKFLGKYLEKNGRAIAEKFYNVEEKDKNGRRWYDLMDETRVINENDKARKGSKVRTYQHFIISLDERDNVTLEDFQKYIDDYVRRWFAEDGSKFGRYEVAVVYHDDNKERTEKGKKGILHAHILVNNTDLNDGSRFAPKMKTNLVRQMRKELNEQAHKNHWYCFAENDKSMSYDDMLAQGLKPKSKGWGDVKNDTLPDSLESEIRDENDEPPAQLEQTMYPKPPSAKPVDKETETKMFLTLTDRSGTKIQVPVDKKYTRESYEERKVSSRKGYSWKGELRDRVYFALTLADTPQQFASVLKDFGVTITQAKDGDIMFHHPDGGAKRCKGATLGKGYTANDIYKEFARKGWRRDEYANRYTGYVPPEMRVHIRARVKTYKTGTLEGTQRMGAMKRLIDYVLKNRITSPDEFGGDELAQAARAAALSMNLFERSALKHKKPEEMTVRERLAWRDYQDTLKGIGGNLAGSSQSVTPDNTRQDGRDTSESNRNIKR